MSAIKLRFDRDAARAEGVGSAQPGKTPDEALDEAAFMMRDAARSLQATQQQVRAVLEQFEGFCPERGAIHNMNEVLLMALDQFRFVRNEIGY